MERYQNIYQSAREGAGLTQEKAAEMLGWSVPNLQAIEQEDRTPTPVRVAEMAEAYRAPWLRGNRCPLGTLWRRPESNVELQQLALEVGLESEDYEQERADAHDLAMIALDRKIDDDESARYNAIVQRMLRRAYLAEMALISGETAKEREN